MDALVVVGPTGDAARGALADVRVLQAPDILLAEVISGIRGLLLGGHVSSGRARAAVAQAASMRREAFPLEPFVDRVWELRHNITVYDAWYVAVAEHLGTELITADRRLVAATGPRCPVVDVRSRNTPPSP